MNTQRNQSMIRLAGIAAAIVCGGYFVVVGIEHATAFPALRFDGTAIVGLASATLFFLATMATAGFAWHIALRAAGEPPRLRAAMAAVMLSQIAKYVPGNIGHIVGRVALARRYGFALPRVLFAMIFETGWNIVSAMIVGVVALVIEGPVLFSALPKSPSELIAVVLVAALAMPIVSAWVLGRWRPAPLARLLMDVNVALPGIAPTLACVALYGFGFGRGLGFGLFGCFAIGALLRLCRVAMQRGRG